MTRSRDPLEFTVHVDGRPVTGELSRRNRAANPDGPRRGSTARVRLDPAAIRAPIPGSFDSDDGGPLDQAWAAYDKAEADLMKALVNAAMPVIGPLATTDRLQDVDVGPERWMQHLPLQLADEGVPGVVRAVAHVVTFLK
jgi:hypothetical protein